MREIKFRAWNSSTEKFRHTEKGLLTNLYQKLKSRNAKKGYGELNFSLDDFKNWSEGIENFHRLFQIWCFDDYSKESKPSVDRIDPTKGYTFENMQWLSWSENYYKGIAEVAKKKEKPILMYKDGFLLGKFRSLKEAQYFLGLSSNGNISENLRGTRTTVKGFNFEYIHENEYLLEETT